jgi:tetratricopeptide (TPR) repeat protein
VRRLAPAAKAALDGRTQPLDPRDEQTVLALVDFYYRQPDAAGQQDLRLAEQLAQRALALTTPGTASSARRPLSYRLVSIYYAQGRYAEGEALRTQLAAGAAPTTPSYPFARQREELIALVRKGELPAALVMARTLVEQRQQAYDAGLQALLQAETAQAQLQRNRATAASAQEQTEVLRSIALAGHAVGQAHTRQNIETFWLAQARSYLGEIQHALGDLDGAAQAYEAALAGFGDGRPGNWQDRTRTRGALAIVARMRKDYARARALQQQVLDELLPLVGEDHPDVQEARAELALLAKLQHG